MRMRWPQPAPAQPGGAQVTQRTLFGDCEPLCHGLGQMASGCSEAQRFLALHRALGQRGGVIRLDLRDPEVRFQLQLALRIMDVLSALGGIRAPALINRI